MGDTVNVTGLSRYPTVARERPCRPRPPPCARNALTHKTCVRCGFAATLTDHQACHSTCSLGCSDLGAPHPNSQANSDGNCRTTLPAASPDRPSSSSLIAPAPLAFTIVVATSSEQPVLQLRDSLMLHPHWAWPTPARLPVHQPKPGTSQVPPRKPHPPLQHMLLRWLGLMLPGLLLLLSPKCVEGQNSYITTLAGNTSGAVGIDNNGHADGLGTATSFDRPSGVAMDSSGTFAVVVRSRMMGGGRVLAAPLH